MITAGWARDTRNSALTPTQGKLTRLGLDYATPLGEVEYLRPSFGNQVFIPITRAVTFANNLTVDYGQGVNGKRFPNFRNFYAGGVGSVRGFAPGGIGPLEDGRALGGNKSLVINNELLFPFPGMGQDRTVRLLTFVDAGAVWGTGTNSPSLDDLRVTAGVGFSWLTPVGPLKLSVGNAVRKEAYDRTQRIQFNIGSAF